MTLHLQGKAGGNISKNKYDQIKEAILMIIERVPKTSPHRVWRVKN